MNPVYHFIGIGGIGMSGLARLLLARRVSVTGSDMASSYITKDLEHEGIKVYIGHSADYVVPGAHVVYTSNVKEDNPEWRKAKELGCVLFHRSDVLAQLMEEMCSLAIAGTHGKTTTSALLASVLMASGLDPSFAVGGIVQQFRTNAYAGKGKFFVAEADESDGTFLKYNPFGAIVTNIDRDHMDYFHSEESLKTAFDQFMRQVQSKEHLFWCGDDMHLASLHPPGVSYGLGLGCKLRAFNIVQKGWKTCFDIEFQGKTYPQIEISLIGQHNVLNALAVFGLVLSLGVNEEQIRHGLREFAGVGRRCEKKGEMQEVLILDDYGHHPTEIRTTLAGIRSRIGPRRLIVLFQPHRYTRTQDCLGSYGNLFDIADELLITDIYGAGEDPILGLSSNLIIEEIHSSSTLPCRYVPRNKLIETASQLLHPYDVVVTLGAGDITYVASELANWCQKNTVPKWRVGVICGGRSVEHEISIRSTRDVCSALSSITYEMQFFGITRGGRWFSDPQAIEQLEQLRKKDHSEEPNIPFSVIEGLLACDVLFPILHGTFGEDGTIQGFFEMLGKPYVGCNHTSSAISMDKALTKRVAIAEGILTSPFVSCSKYEWITRHQEILTAIESQLKYPLFVKPSHLGSSIGVSKVEKPQTLENTIAQAFRVDTHIIIENGIVGREIEFAVWGNDEVTVYPPGEILIDGKVYDYDAKYGANAVEAATKTDLSPEVCQEGMRLAEKIYRVLGCTGMARIDFFYDKQGTFWFNELNPIPGLRKHSMFPLLCVANGMPLDTLWTQLILLALERNRSIRRCKLK